MYRLKTNGNFIAPIDRGTVSTVIRFIIDGLFIDKNNITPKGYYYWYDESGKIYQRHIGDITLLETVKQLEDSETVPSLQSNVNIYDNVIQRLGELTKLQMIAEEGQNFGTLASDWVIDTDEIQITNPLSL
jgi:hypothetical protein